VSAANTRGRLRLDLSDDDSEDNGANNAETDILVSEDSDTKTMGLLESHIQRKVPDTRFLKEALKLRNVTGLSNAPYTSKVSAICSGMVL
jgi:hypothetical protein